MKYCCNEFEFVVKNYGGFAKIDGTWCIPGCTVWPDIKFCPFCGKNLRFIVQRTTGSILFDWKVTDKGKTVAYFDSQKDAQDYADKRD